MDVNVCLRPYACLWHICVCTYVRMYQADPTFTLLHYMAFSGRPTQSLLSLPYPPLVGWDHGAVYPAALAGRTSTPSGKSPQNRTPPRSDEVPTKANVMQYSVLGEPSLLVT